MPTMETGLVAVGRHGSPGYADRIRFGERVTLMETAFSLRYHRCLCDEEDVK
jgi:hypothetical protein